MARKTKSPEVLAAEQRAFQMKQMRGNHIPPPNRRFEVGEQVVLGVARASTIKTTVLEVFDGGLFYRIRNLGTHLVYGKVTPLDEEQYWPWYDLSKLGVSSEESVGLPDRWMRLSYSQRCISGLLNQFYGSGIDLSPEYQRGNVWTPDDEVKLIESIFLGADIGKFVLVERDFAKVDYDHNGCCYEMLDGKQRLTALARFYEDRFTYKGKTHSQLNWADQCHFRDYPVSYAQVNDMPLERKCRLFLALNTSGHVCAQAHLEMVRRMMEGKGTP